MKHASRNWIRILAIGIAATLLSVILLVAYVAYSFYFSPLPQTDGVTRVEGLQDPVTVYRDSWAIPQLYATNNADLYFTMGYVHAQDRWWQMELSRYIAMGRLHEILLSDRETVLDADHLMRIVNLERMARARWQSASPEARRVLNAYAAGVNAYIQGREVRALASEYGLIGLSGQFDNLMIYLGRDVDIEPWEPYQSLLLLGLFEFAQANDIWQPFEQALIEAAASTGDQRAAPLAHSAIPTLPTHSTATDTETQQALYAQKLAITTRDFVQRLGLVGPYGGVAWALGGERTQSGGGLLSVAAQAPPEIPGIWYEIGLHCTNIQPDCTYAAVGFSLAGVPAIFSGHNGTIAWGFNPTGHATFASQTVTLNPENKLQYFNDGDWQALDTVSIGPTTVATTDVEAQFPPRTVYDSEFGAVVTALEGQTALTLQQQIIADDDPLGAVLQAMQATNWNTFQEALTTWKHPTAAWLYADTAGNIGYQVGGAARLQHTAAAAMDHRLTSDPPPTIPTTRYNPPESIIILVDGQLMPQTQQQQAFHDHINALLDRQTHATADGIAQIQGDTQSLLGPVLLPYLEGLSVSDEADTTEFLTDTRDWVLDWEYHSDQESTRATVFNLWVLEVLMSLHLTEAATLSHAERLELVWQLPELMRFPQHPVWDNPRTLVQEERDTQLSDAFVTVIERLVAQFGRDYEQWAWGTVHQVDFNSRVIGQQDLWDLNVVVSAGPFPLNRSEYGISGALDTLNRTAYWFEMSSEMPPPDVVPTMTIEDLHVALVPVYRLIIDMGDLDSSRAMHNTGQSGHPASDHYVDMIAPWRTLDYHNLRWGIDAIRNSATRELELRPAQPEG
jgi:penicillin G amidase